MIDLLLLLTISYLQNYSVNFEINTNAAITHVYAENETVENTSIRINHIDSYFWTIVPEKTQCGKIGAVDEGFVFIFNNER